MRSAGWWRMAAVIALLSACGPSSTPGAHVTSSPSSTATLSTPQNLGVCDPTHRCLALVTLRGSSQIVVRDVTDIDHPATVSAVSVSSAKFVSASELSYTDGTNLYRMPLDGSSKTLVARAMNGIDLGLFAWSSDAQTAAYMTTNGLNVISAGEDRALGEPLPTAGAYGCENRACADSWDARLAFSPDASYISLVVMSGPVTGFKLWSSDGKLLALAPSQGPTMSVWSGRTLYFRDAGGVEAWTHGATAQFLPGVQWVRPKASPAGGLILYEARDPAGLAHVYLVDTNTKSVKELKAGRSEPAFLTSRYVWYRGERACVASENCPLGGPFIDNGKTYIYDLQTGTEYESIITNVYDTWPHAA